MVDTPEDVFTEEDYANYSTSIASIVKKCWISLQVIIMMQFMIRGLIYYTRLIKHWTKVQWLLLFQGFQFMYLIINEFAWHNMTGIYMNLLLCSYGHFLTFCVTMDSCVSKEDNSQNSNTVRANRIGRIFFHVLFVILLGMVYFARSCEEHIYPFAFCLLGLFILAA